MGFCCAACRVWENDVRFTELQRVKLTFHYHRGNHYTMTTDTKTAIPAGAGFLKTCLRRHVLTTFFQCYLFDVHFISGLSLSRERGLMKPHTSNVLINKSLDSVDLSVFMRRGQALLILI